MIAKKGVINVEWEEVAPEEMKALKFSSRSSGRVSEYQGLLDAIKSGKSVKVSVPAGVTPKALSQRLYTASKPAGIRIACRTLADRSALVINLIPDETPVVSIVEEAPQAEISEIAEPAKAGRK